MPELIHGQNFQLLNVEECGYVQFCLQLQANKHCWQLSHNRIINGMLAPAVLKTCSFDLFPTNQFSVSYLGCIWG